MKHYKDENNNIYAYEADGSQDTYILPNLVAITDEEAEDLRKPPPPSLVERKAEKQREIDTLEATLFMTRGEREAWLIQLETIATQQSVSLDVLYQANPFYKKLKDCDVAVTALRAELKAMV